ncbi:glucosamine 6-phosphate synthetase [Vibrio galatheae]|uniref:Glucosamine 6-phosphate synthetase n=1 Tax=Vibrio galatheae TaxID=579748 RepID=A0A0F4NM19_9VIBR|nr:glucosamine 6-phosphate synthetase [Vibrio galatheae]KJY84157.1 glucosamine 6-phosphate synthetase [Vibrio galatheae]
MCGIFGVISDKFINKEHFKVLAKHSRQRGRDSSGIVKYDENGYATIRADYDIKKLLNQVELGQSSLALGHSRLITNGLSDNQPVIRDGIIAIHNGIIVNDDELWGEISIDRKFQIDSEVIIGIALDCLSKGMGLEEIPDIILSKCKGVIACALLFPELGKALLFSNNGSLYVSNNAGSHYFSSESYPLSKLNLPNIEKVMGQAIALDIPKAEKLDSIVDYQSRKLDLVPALSFNPENEALLEYHKPGIKRCTKCILPETMPFIHFDNDGVCNYCHSYKPRNQPKPKEQLFELVEPYRRKGEPDCIVPFSGGRDSCYGLHLIVEELKMKPITYTYDWGMVTDLGRRNISRMCSQLGVENIIVAANIDKKRQNVARNLKAWLKSPHLGMMSILTAGDKHFFRHVETVKKQTGIDINLWGVNPLEVTHFKTGFLDIPPDFEGKHVYTNGVMKQLHYQKKRFGAMLDSPGYFNSSLFDTLSGEYFRSFTEKKDYFHLFDFWRWDEQKIDSTLLNVYDWEKAIDTPTTWRIGDATAAFYNYVYYTVAGFTEHDTFRSNQIREGDITREQALAYIEEENRPRYPNIKWYLDVLGLDYKEVIRVVNSIPKLYSR